MPSVKSKTTVGDRAFAVAAPSLWNSLPSELRSITCVNSFQLILRPIFLDMHILNRDFNNTFVNYLSISFYHLQYIFFNVLVVLAIFSINQSSLLSYVRHGCPVARARGSCLKRKTIKLSIVKLYEIY